MKNLMGLYGAAILVLLVTTGYLWREVRTDRQLIAELQSQGVAQPAAVNAPLPATPATATTVDARPALPPDVPHAPSPPPAPAAPPAPPPVPTLPATVRISGAEVSLRAAALADADQTATARVLAWRDRLQIAGQTLTTPQLQALDAAARAELRREAEASLERAREPPPTDLEGSFRLREENLNRQNDANLRILDAVTTQLNAEQIRALRTQFDTGHAARMATLKAEREMAAQGR